jgi:hypothetical protein
MHFRVLLKSLFLPALLGPGHPYEKRARDICARLKRRGIEAVIVEVTAGQDFAEMTVHCTHIMQVMLVIGCDEYGAKTKNGYCSFHELQLAYQNRIPIIVVQFSDNWPPKPSKNDLDGAGAKQNKFVLGRQGHLRLRWNNKREWNADQCTEEIADAFGNLQRDASSSQDIQVPTNNILPNTLETEYKSSRALDKVVDNQIDVCIISLHSPSMLHRLSQSSTFIYDMERKLKTFSKDNDVSILLVDGRDNSSISQLIKKDFQGIPSIVFAGEGLEDETWMTDKIARVKSKQSDIAKLVNKMKHLNPRPKVCIAFKYGGGAFKSILVSEGLQDVSVWEHGTLFDSGGTLQEHLSSLSKRKPKGGSGVVETKTWSPPTLNWTKEHSELRNLRLKVGDFEEIVEIKGAVNEAIRSGTTKCFNIKPHPSLIGNEDIWFRTRAITLYMCQECSKDLRDTSRSTFMGWYFVSKKEHLTEVANDIKGHSGRIVIWLDVGGSTSDFFAFDLTSWLGETEFGDLQVVYIITSKGAEHEQLEETITGPIRKNHGLKPSEDVHAIEIGRFKTDIDLSQKEVNVDVTLDKTSKNCSLYKLQNIITEEFFDSTQKKDGQIVDISDPLEQREASFYKGDDESIHMHLGIRDIKQLKKVFALMFFPDSRDTLERKLKSIGLGTKLDFKMRNALKVFKQCVLELDTLTPDQKRVRKKAKKQKRVVIDGRAGSGKTYLALYFILERLTSDKIKGKDNDGFMLFCFDAESLGNEIVKWLCTRFGNSISISEKNTLLRRIHFLYNTGCCS